MSWCWHTLPEALGAPDFGSRVRYVDAALGFGEWIAQPFDTTKASHNAKLDRAAEFYAAGDRFEAEALVWEANTDLAQLGLGVQAAARGSLRLAAERSPGGVEIGARDIDLDLDYHVPETAPA